jgi:hypothetical protein
MNEAETLTVQNPENSKMKQMETYFCPLSLNLMLDPVITRYGHCFQRKAILDWLSQNNVCPITGKPLHTTDIFPCFALKEKIESALKEFGLETLLSLRHISGHGKIKIPERFKQTVIEHSAVSLRQLDNTPYPLFSAYLTFPPPFSLLWGVRTTGYIVLGNTHPKESLYMNAYKRKDNINCGSFELKPKSQQGFDIGGAYCIEIERGNVEYLEVVDFARFGGGKGNWLGMNS